MPDNFLHFVHKKTGNIVTVDQSDLSYFEDGEDDDNTFEDSHEWEREALLLAKDVVISDDYLELPSLESFEDYNMMEEFCLSIESSEIQEKLLCAIQGKGAFSRFKADLHCFDIEKKWYRYRHEYFKKIAVEWCKSQGFAYKYNLPSYLTDK